MESKVDLNKIYLDINKFQDKLKLIKEKMNYKNMQEQLKNIELEMNDEAFWNNIQKASKTSTKHKKLQSQIKNINDIELKIRDLQFLIKEMPDEHDELTKTHNIIQEQLKILEVDSLLNQEYDSCNIFLEIHPGAGGVDSQDFAEMLGEMYEKYFNKNGILYKTVEKQKGEVAGIKSIIYEVQGTNLFGLFKKETGIHRLIRISPFDSGNRRHTSFASVKVTPIINNPNFQIDERDLKIDTFRSSGAGGQSVNTTDSAVRITHITTGITVSCQNERSQIQNKDQALKILISKLVILEKEKQDQESKEIVGELKSNSFGSQKRTYTLHPYKLVKDHISGYETSQAEKVLMGEIDQFIYANLIK